MHVLIADDEELERDYLKQALKKKYGHDLLIDEAENGKDSLKLCNKQFYDLIIMDIEMPLMNGLEVIEQIRKFNQESVIIISTAHSVFDYARQAVSLGIKEYLVKPYSSKTLWDVLDKAGLSHPQISKDEQLMKQISHYISIHYAQTITLDEIADHVGLSRYYVSRILNHSEGRSLSSMINQYRIEKAKEYLAQGKQVNEISYLVGYQDPAYFSKTFKKITGISPSQYSESLK